MVGSGLPQCIKALHSLETDQDILHGIIKRVSHVKLSRNVGRRDHDGKRSFSFVHFGMEIFLIQPLLI